MKSYLLAALGISFILDSCSGSRCGHIRYSRVRVSENSASILKVADTAACVKVEEKLHISIPDVVDIGPADSFVVFEEKLHATAMQTSNPVNSFKVQDSTSQAKKMRRREALKYKRPFDYIIVGLSLFEIENFLLFPALFISTAGFAYLIMFILMLVVYGMNRSRKEHNAGHPGIFLSMALYVSLTGLIAALLLIAVLSFFSIIFIFPSSIFIPLIFASIAGTAFYVFLLTRLINWVI